MNGTLEIKERKDRARYRTFILFFPFFAAAFIRLANVYWNEIDIQFFSSANPGARYTGAIFGGNIILILLCTVPLAFHQSLLRMSRFLSFELWVTFIFVIISITYSNNQTTTAIQILTLLLCIFYALLLASSDGNFAFFSIWVISFILVFLSVVLYLFNDPHVMMAGLHAGSVRGLFPHKNLFGPFAVFLILITVFCGNNINVSISFKFFAIMTSIFAVFLSHSSGSVVQLGVGLLAGYYSLLVKKRGRSRIIYHILAITFLLCSFISYDFLLIQVAEILGKDTTLSNRTLIWSIALPWSFQHPFGTGFGTSGGEALQNLFRSGLALVQGSSVQNGFINMALDVGWLPTAIFAWWLVKLLLVSVGKYPLLTAAVAFYLCLSITEVVSMLVPNAFLLSLFVYFVKFQKTERNTDVSAIPVGTKYPT